MRKNTKALFKDAKVHFYDMHDGKMLYVLTQHSLWNRKYHPFLLCKCTQGERVLNPHHKCKIFTNEEQLEYYNRSVRRWEKNGVYRKIMI